MQKKNHSEEEGDVEYIPRMDKEVKELICNLDKLGSMDAGKEKGVKDKRKRALSRSRIGGIRVVKVGGCFACRTIGRG